MELINIIMHKLTIIIKTMQWVWSQTGSEKQYKIRN